MPDYSKTKIYYIQIGEERYYGHTTRSLEKRRDTHRSEFNRLMRLHEEIIPEHRIHVRPTPLYTAMREKPDIHLVLVEEYPCENLRQALARESWWINRFGTLNVNTYDRTDEEKRESIKQYMQQYITLCVILKWDTSYSTWKRI